MTNLTWWKRSLMVTAATVAAVAAIAGQPQQGRSADTKELSRAQDDQKFQYFGSATCKGCHNVTAANPTAFPKAIGFIKLDEWKTWVTEDKHSLAYKRLNSDRGRRMAGLLGIDVNKPGAGCLGCHSASVKEATNRSPAGSEFDLSDGVSCENCHGPYSEWSARHLLPSFRTKEAANWNALQFIDLRSPEGQATKCLSCHIGSSSEGKVVTHEMYAAGHPPLPSVEVATFTNLIPRHWWLLAERKSEPLQRELGYVKGELEQTKLALVGAAVALKTSMNLLADEAKLPGKGAAPGEEWPDYARFDCWSCHHDLVRNGWRQQRGFQGAPGRVPVTEWPLALVELGIERLAIDNAANAAVDRAELKRLVNAVRDQADSRPFGRKPAMAKAAEELATWADGLIKKLGAKSYDKAVAETLLRKLVENEKAKGLNVDYDSARHVSWMIKLLIHELGGKLPNQPEIDGFVAELDKMLNLDLPAGTKFEIEDNLKNALERIGTFEPLKFQEQLEKLLPLL